MNDKVTEGALREILQQRMNRIVYRVWLAGITIEVSADGSRVRFFSSSDFRLRTLEDCMDREIRQVVKAATGSEIETEYRLLPPDETKPFPAQDGALYHKPDNE